MKPYILPYTLTLPYPLSVNIYWRNDYNNHHTYISKKGMSFKKTVQKLYGYICRPVHTSVKLNIIIHPKLTKKGVASTRLIDLDNGLKCVLDSLIGIAYHDDKQVKKLSVEYGSPLSNGATTVEVLPIDA